MKRFIDVRIPAIIVILLLTALHLPAANMVITSLSGSVTAAEINSFITYMQNQSPPQTPWGDLAGTGHNAWADGTGGRELEAMGEIFEVSSNLTILNLMVSWADDCTSQRNDLMSADNGGQRVMWTGLIDKVWCPNWPGLTTYNQYLYCGCETEDLIGHLAYCAKLILRTPAIWSLVVPDGDPHGYGATYFQRATNYLAKCDEANDEYFLKWFVQPGTSLIRPPANSAWTALNENVTAINRQMMFTSGFQRLAEAHELLGDAPARVAQYDAIVKAATTECVNGMVHFPGNPRTVNGQPAYRWHYYPTDTSGIETTEIHAEYDLIGAWRAFNRAAYGFTRAPLVPFANTLVNVIYLGTNSFAVNVDGSGGLQQPIYSGWLLTADWNPQVYDTVAGAALTNGWYKSSADIEAGILYLKNRRDLKFSITPAPAAQTVLAGNTTKYDLSVAPLGGFTNSVNLVLLGLPAGAVGIFSSASVNLGWLDVVSTNVTVSVSTSTSTPGGTYPLSLISISGTVYHTNRLTLTVAKLSLSASPASQVIAPGQAAAYTINVVTDSGTDDPVSFAVSGLPANCGGSFSPSMLNGTGSTTLNLVASNNVAAGDYMLTIFGANSMITNYTTAELRIVTPTNLAAAVVGGQLVLSWPEDHVGCRLQVQTNPPGQGLNGTWFTVPGTDSVDAYTNALIPGAGSLFFRLSAGN